MLALCNNQDSVYLTYTLIALDISLESKGGFIIDMNGINPH